MGQAVCYATRRRERSHRRPILRPPNPKSQIPNLPFTCSPVPLFPCFPVPLFPCSPAHLLTCSPAHLLTCSPAHLLTCSFRGFKVEKSQVVGQRWEEVTRDTQRASPCVDPPSPASCSPGPLLTCSPHPLLTCSGQQPAIAFVQAAEGSLYQPRHRGGHLALAGRSPPRPVLPAGLARFRPAVLPLSGPLDRRGRRRAGALGAAPSQHPLAARLAASHQSGLARLPPPPAPRPLPTGQLRRAAQRIAGRGRTLAARLDPPPLEALARRPALPALGVAGAAWSSSRRQPFRRSPSPKSPPLPAAAKRLAIRPTGEFMWKNRKSLTNGGEAAGCPTPSSPRHDRRGRPAFPRRLGPPRGPKGAFGR